MDSLPSSRNFLFLFLISIVFFVSSSSGSFLSNLKPPKRAHQHKLASHRRELVQTTQHDFMNPPFTNYPTTPVTNPVTTPATGGGGGGATIPPDPSTPPIIAVPSPYPITPTPIPPAIDPTNPPVPVPVTNPPVPVTNPVTTPSTTFPGGVQPGTGYPTTPTGGGITNPVVPPPAVVNAPAVPGQSWCVARGGLPENVLQVALDYACGMGGADCSAIQQGASCYNPNSLQNHASYAFNTYFQKNPVQTSCDFGGAAMITNVNPSSGSCIFGTWSSSTASPGTMSPTTTTPIPTPTTPIPTPTTGSTTGAAPASYGTPPSVMNASNPALGGGIAGFGEIPPTASTSFASTFKPFVCCITVVVSIITGSIPRGI